MSARRRSPLTQSLISAARRAGGDRGRDLGARGVERHDLTASRERAEVVAIVLTELVVAGRRDDEALVEIGPNPQLVAQQPAQPLVAHARPRERRVVLGRRREPRAHLLRRPIDRVRRRLGRHVPIDFRKHQLPIDELRQHGRHRVIGRSRGDHPQLEGGEHVTLHDHRAADDGQHAVDDFAAHAAAEQGDQRENSDRKSESCHR